MRRKISKQDILSTGMGLFHQLGYNGVSVGDITGKAGIPKGSFYNHFQSKQEFLEQVLDAYALESLKLVQKHLLDASIPPLQRLSGYFEEATEYYSQDPERLNGCLMGNICQELASLDGRIRLKLESNFQATDALLSSLLSESIQRKELDRNLDIDALVPFITNGWQGALLRMKSLGNRKPLENFQQVLFRNLLRPANPKKPELKRPGQDRNRIIRK
jgi:TetR/AcrR family transcriptional regulator, transcriptional repressor for nem operon